MIQVSPQKWYPRTRAHLVNITIQWHRTRGDSCWYRQRRWGSDILAGRFIGGGVGYHTIGLLAAPRDSIDIKLCWLLKPESVTLGNNNAPCRFDRGYLGQKVRPNPSIKIDETLAAVIYQMRWTNKARSKSRFHEVWCWWRGTVYLKKVRSHGRVTIEKIILELSSQI